MVPIIVRTYTGKRQSDAAEVFAKDAILAAADGYEPVSQSWAEGRSGCLRIIGLGFIGALVWKPAGSLTVTYRHTGEAVPVAPVPAAPEDFWSR